MAQRPIVQWCSISRRRFCWLLNVHKRAPFLRTHLKDVQLDGQCTEGDGDGDVPFSSPTTKLQISHLDFFDFSVHQKHKSNENNNKL